MATEALGKVGVEAVVEGLSQFKGNISDLNKSIASVGDQGNILTQALSGVGNMFNWLGEQIVNVATYALGKLLADAVEFVVSKIGELISNTIQAGAEFQTLSLRLNRLNFNDLVASGDHYISVMNMAKDVTKEQLEWIQKLAIQTPYDAQDIANVFTLARSYGFAATEAEGLTKDITDFAAGMGLGNTEIQRIIINFGQLKQEGKVTGKELNDLARGAFVPVNDILEQMQKDTGLTGAAFVDFKKTGEGVNAFMKAFSEIAESRFAGASQDMARTLKGASDNAQDFIKSLFGLNVVKPVLDEVGGKIADLVTSLTTDQNWTALQDATQKLGSTLTDVLGGLFGKIDTTGFVQGLLGALNQVTSWISDHKNDILGFFKGIGETIQSKVVPFITDKLLPGVQGFIGFLVSHRGDAVDFFKSVGNNVGKVAGWVQNNLVPAFNKFSDWVNTNKPTIDTFFTALGTIIGKVIDNLTGGKLDSSGLSGLLDTVTAFMQYVIDNQDQIATWVTNLIKLWSILQIVGAVLSFVAGVLISVGTAILGVVAFVGGLVALFTALATPIGLLVALLGILIYQWAVYGDTVKAFLADTGAAIAQWWTDLWVNFEIGANALGESLILMWTNFIQFFSDGITSTKTAIAQWWTDLWVNFEIGANALGETLIAMWTNTYAAYIAWGTNLQTWTITTFDNMLASITNWTTTTSATFSTWTASVLGIFTAWWTNMLTAAITGFKNILAAVAQYVALIKSGFQEQDWYLVGERIIQGISKGVKSAAQALVNQVVAAAKAAIAAVENALGISSPSKVFEDLGIMTMRGMAQGIMKSMGLVTGAMDSMATAVAMPMINLPAVTQQYAVAATPMVNTQNSYTNNFNLTVNSASSKEPIIQDYNMMKSIVQA